MFSSIIVTVVTLLYSIIAASAQTFEQDCASLSTRLKIDSTHISLSHFIPGGRSLSIKESHPDCLAQRNQTEVVVPANVCRVVAYTATSSRSGINFEIWFPQNWSGRFMSHGNGGLSGCIAHQDLAYSTLNDFVAVSANSGHNGSSGDTMYQNPDVVMDYSWRSVHTAVVVGKQMTEFFYNRTYTKSYYMSCSTGGRQGFKAVQEFPEDFDGVVAGAPAFAFTNLTSWSGNFFKITGPPGSSTFVPRSMWAVVHDDILQKCDKLDGAEDGILEETSRCRYNPAGLACNNPNSRNSTCLTDAQVNTVKQIYSPFLQKDGSLIYPRMPPGVGYSSLFGGAPFSITKEWFRNVVFSNKEWDPANLSLADIEFAAKLNPNNIETWKGDLSEFKNHGKKVIHYHGLADPLISAENSARYYEHVRTTMDLNYSEMDSFYRYFRISGMGHCGNGDGAWAFGQSAKAEALLSAEGNILTAIIRWVEQDVPPDVMTGTKWVNDDPSKGISFRRRHCKYPKRNKFNGKGAHTDPMGWECVS